MADQDKILLGTSGWSYKEWIGPFYSKEDKSMLRAYAKVFKTAEIDSTFYRYPSKGMVMGWTKYTPEDFVFAAKLPRLITHEKKLDMSRDVEKDVQRFIELMEPLWLSGKLGCILIQLPPRCNFRPKEMEDFFKTLPTQVRFAVEFRHHSWMRPETWALLEKYKIAYTIVDEPLLPPEVHVTSDIAYLRWHGRGNRPWYDYEYKKAELEPWVPKVQEVEKKAGKVFGYFNNHYRGYAVKNCLQAIEMLGTIDPVQAKAKDKVESFLKSQDRTRESKLETFGEPKTTDFEELLRFFTAAGRLERARDIPDAELSITKESDEKIEAKIRDYHAIIDSENKTILHDCQDWSKTLSTGKLCKHMAKLLLSINRERATRILREMYSQPEAWQYRAYSDTNSRSDSL